MHSPNLSMIIVTWKWFYGRWKPLNANIQQCAKTSGNKPEHLWFSAAVLFWWKWSQIICQNRINYHSSYNKVNTVKILIQIKLWFRFFLFNHSSSVSTLSWWNQILSWRHWMSGGNTNEWAIHIHTLKNTLCCWLFCTYLKFGKSIWAVTGQLCIDQLSQQELSEFWTLWTKWDSKYNDMQKYRSSYFECSYLPFWRLADLGAEDRIVAHHLLLRQIPATHHSYLATK